MIKITNGAMVFLFMKMLFRFCIAMGVIAVSKGMTAYLRKRKQKNKEKKNRKMFFHFVFIFSSRLCASVVKIIIVPYRNPQ